MNDRFWLGYLPGLEGGWTPWLRPFVEGEPPFGLVLEALQGAADPSALTLLVSVVDAQRTYARCVLALSNRPDRVDALRTQGVIAIETSLRFDEPNGVLRVEVPPGLRAAADDGATAGDGATAENGAIEIEGVGFVSDPRGEAFDWPVRFSQERWAPQVGLEAMALSTRAIEWIVEHGDARVSKRPCSVRVDRRGPVLRDLPALPPKVVAHWCGSVDLSPPRALSAPKVGGSRAWPWQVKRYEYEDVDLLGFRIDLSGRGRRADDALDALVAPLNFHRGTHGANLAFEYRPAARVLVVEFLRYPRMKTVMAAPMGLPELVGSQYEMLVRVLVGRVDDGSRRARAPAVHVPLIYVDNPWSRLVGRETQGMDKRLAAFLDRAGRRLQPFDARGEPSDLGLLDLCEVRAAPDVPFSQGSAGATIATIDIPDVQQVQRQWADRAQRLDAAGALLLGGARWRQRDFAGRAFRRDFARQVLRDDPRRFRLLQCTLNDGRGLPGAWIESEFAFGNAMVDFPTGVATLEFGTLPRSKVLDPLADLLGHDAIGLPTGDWYVGRCSMKQTVQSSLDDA